MAKQISREEWKERIAACKSSGLSQRMWCENNQISISAFQYWICKFNKEAAQNDSSSKWIKVNTAEPEKSSESSPVTVVIGKASVKLSSDFDRKLFSDVVQILTSLC